jgi:hypothetical protein
MLSLSVWIIWLPLAGYGLWRGYLPVVVIAVASPLLLLSFYFGMKKPRWRIPLLRIIGAVLCLAGLTAGYFWFYHWGPFQRIYDPSWFRRHSDVAQWEEYQACVRRSGWTHDGAWIVGRSGNKQWVDWIVDHAHSDDDLIGCSAGHKDHGLRFLTNQDAGTSAAAWHAWWEQNKTKSQEDWIREGFRKYDIDLQTPLTPANTIALLKLAARTDEQKGGSPDYIQYNAFRWLRDSDFNPEEFAVKDIPAKDADRVLQGLVRFSRLSGEHSKYDGIGVLNLGEPYTPYDSRPPMLEPEFQILVNAVIFVPLCAALLLLWLSFRLNRKKTTSGGDVQEGG